jgi:ferredoxin-NADP reductase
LIEDTVAAVTAPRLESLGVQQLEGHRYAAYRAGPLMPGDRVEIQLPAGKFQAQTLLPYLIAVLVAGMVLALVWALRKRPSPA